MKRVLLISFLLSSAFFFSYNLIAQTKDTRQLDSLFTLLLKAKEDKNKMNLLNEIVYTYLEINPEKGLKYEKEAIQLAEKLNWKPDIARIKSNIARLYWRLGKFDTALKLHFDALKIYEESGNKPLTAPTLIAIGQDYADGGKYPEAKKYFTDALTMYTELRDSTGMAYAYGFFSWVYGNEGDIAGASKANFAALKIYEAMGDQYSASVAMTNMADYEVALGNYAEAINYYVKCLKPQEDANDKINLSNTYNNIGNVYMHLGNYAEALKNHRIALRLGQEINNTYTMASAYHAMGDVYVAEGNHGDALHNFLSSAELFKAVSNKQALAGVYNKIGICYIRLADYTKAKKYFDDELALSKELSSKVTSTDYYRGAELFDSVTGNWKSAYFNFKYYTIGHDSLFNRESTKKMVQSQMQYNSDKKEAAIRTEQEKKDIRQRTIRNSIAGTLAGTLIFLAVVYRQRNKISKARKRSDELLLNILPEEVAEELKEKGSADAKHFNEVTVMFTDFKNFTQISEKLSPSELVAEINTCFKAFDLIVTKHNIEKIKTIGDAYMCAGGLPVPNETHAEDIVRAALEMQEFMKERTAAGSGSKQSAANPPPAAADWQLRIGIHTGPVVAGIVGVKKFAYDIWGDTVNIASRMEGSGEAGKVNISGRTYELVKGKFNCTHRGKIEAKNKGEIDMYFVKGLSQSVWHIR